MEKYLLRKSFELEHIIPNDILWRKKEAFSDAVSNKRKSWFEYINDYVNTQINPDDKELNNFSSKEAYWYYKLFKSYYPNYEYKIQNWLPKWCGDIQEPSARVLIDIEY